MVILLGHLLNCIMKLIDDIHSIFTKSMEPILGQIWFLGSVEAVAGKIALQSVFQSQNAFLGSSVHPSLNSLLRESVWSWLILVYKYQIAPGSISGRLVILSFCRHMLEDRFVERRSSWTLAVQVYLGGAVGAGPARNSWKNRQCQYTVPFYNSSV